MIAFCRKGKTNVETPSLRNLKIMPRNLNEILFSWKPSEDSNSRPPLYKETS